jgi:hypothetical protein
MLVHQPLGDYRDHEGETEDQAAHCSNRSPTCPTVRRRHPASGESSDLNHGIAARIWRREVSGPGWVQTDRTMLKEPSSATP